MAKYQGSPWGHILGKVSSVVGGKWRGIKWVREYVVPENKSGVTKYLLYLQGKYPEFNFPQFHLRQVVIEPLGKIARWQFDNLIAPIWNRYVYLKGLQKISGTSLFMKANIRTLYGTIGNKDIMFTRDGNFPFYKTMIVSTGDLEPTPAVTSAQYSSGTGNYEISWLPDCYGNGKATDNAYVVIFEMDEDMVSSYRAYKNVYWFATAKKRGDGLALVKIQPDIDHGILTGFVYFRDEDNEIGYSESRGTDTMAW